MPGPEPAHIKIIVPFRCDEAAQKFAEERIHLDRIALAEPGTKFSI